MRPLLLTFSLLILSSNLSAKSWPNNHPFKPDLIDVYKTVEGKALDLHIFYPNSSKPNKSAPAIVLFHGGGFSKGSPNQFYYLCDYLASRGMVAISVRYRLNNNNIECLRDAKSAMRYVYANAEKYGIDANKVAAGGGSAGGCLAAALSTSELIHEASDDLSISPKPRALVLFNPVYSSKGAMRETQEFRDDFTPIENIDSEIAPALALFGDNDKFVDVPTMKLFQQKMLDAGVRSELVIYPGALHSFFNDDKDIVVSTVRHVDVFLKSLGFLEGEPMVEEWASKI